MAHSVINLPDSEGRTGNVVIISVDCLVLLLHCVALHLAVAAGNHTLVDTLVSVCACVRACVFVYICVCSCVLV